MTQRTTEDDDTRPLPLPLPTRADYLAGRVTHEAYYRSVYQHAGIGNLPLAEVEQVLRALAAGDEHLNSIRLWVWDCRALAAQSAITRSLRAHGEGWSLASGVCTMKAAYRDAAQTIAASHGV